MHSPKFEFSYQEIEKVINKYSLKKAWKSKVRRQLRKQIIIDLIEFNDIDERIDFLSDELSQSIKNGRYVTQLPKRYLVEKSRGLCRQMTLGHPSDLIILQCLSDSLYRDIKKNSPSKGAFFEPGDHKFSKFKEISGEYGAFASWKKFQKEIFKFSRENKFIVVTDVANFYDFINFRQLRNIISSICEVREPILDILIYILNNLSWTPDFMPRTEMGMPQMETDAPRVLANAMLYEVDLVAEKNAYRNYARFMDDIDLGVHSIREAKLAIKEIDLTLQSRQLRLNSSKTKILTQIEAFDHFCIKENQRLARYEIFLKKFKSSKHMMTWLRSRLEGIYEDWYARRLDGSPSRDCRFLRGNGEKILKWISRLIIETGGNVPTDDLVWFIKNMPTVRENCFHYLSFTKKTNYAQYKILKILKSGLFIDDKSLVNYAMFIVNCRFKKSAKLEDSINETIEIKRTKGDFGFYAGLLISTKFSNPDQILSLIRKHKKQWRNDFWLGRTVGGCTPRFIFDAIKYNEFLILLRSVRCDYALDVVTFHQELITDYTKVKKLKIYFMAENYSFSQKIFFPKILMIISASKNTLSSSLIKNLKNTHSALTKDPYIKSLGI